MSAGKWAVIATESSPSSAGSIASRIREGVFMAMRPAGSFDACSRSVDGEYLVYACYVGDETPGGAR